MWGVGIRKAGPLRGKTVVESTEETIETCIGVVRDGEEGAGEGGGETVDME